jgi:hypothetical protein
MATPLPLTPDKTSSLPSSSIEISLALLSLNNAHPMAESSQIDFSGLLGSTYTIRLRKVSSAPSFQLNVSLRIWFSDYLHAAEWNINSLPLFLSPQ